jgi:hypothetical protein
LNGSEIATMILMMERINPYGSHINIANDSDGVGFRANLPSWKISGFGYFSGARFFQLLLSPCDTT